jgi:F-type H+-transporting ATPase subunit delta
MPTHTDAVAKVYARSLFSLAEEAGDRDKILEIADELEQICELMRVDRDFAEFLASPIIDKKRRTETLRRIFADNVTDLTLRFLLVLNGKGRLGHFMVIQSAYDQLVQEMFGRVEVDVFTPVGLGEDQLETIKGRIQDALGKEPVLHQYTDESMIGGLKLRIGDQLIDGSVATQLGRMRQELLGTHMALDGEDIGRFIEEGGDA